MPFKIIYLFFYPRFYRSSFIRLPDFTRTEKTNLRLLHTFQRSHRTQNEYLLAQYH